MSETIKPAGTNAADREKKWAALSSVLAAVFLTTLKIVVGILTHSLGILAEAAHSALDLVAAAVTYLAVKYSGRPADQAHTYGHGKIENLSALFETLLLLITCVWIVYEAINRLFFKHVEVEANLWSFVVMAISIGVDISRSRMLGRVAKKYDSQALEADALHFSTDIWSSAVVIGGLALIAIAGRFHVPWLVKADSIAAMAVAGIVVYVSLQLGRRAVAELLDEVPENLQGKITAAARLPGVHEVQQARVRRSGPDYFIDLTLAVDRLATSDQAHDLAAQVEQAIQVILPRADVMVHVNPVQLEDEELADCLRVLAARHDLGVHHIHVMHVHGENILTVHLDVKEELNIEQAHLMVDEFEEAVSSTCPTIHRVISHIEPAYRQPYGEMNATERKDKSLEHRILEIPKVLNTPCDIHDIAILSHHDGVDIAFHCTFPPETPVVHAHELTIRMEEYLHAQVTNLGQVIIHVEPA